MAKKKILILFAHPAYQKSRANRRLVDGVNDLDGVTFRDLYELDPDFDIDVKQEQQLLIDHDVVVFHHPLMKTEGGQSSFSVLLFQDIAVIPMLALFPLLAVGEAVGGQGDGNLIGHLSGWQQGLVVVALVVGIVIAGRVLMRPVFRFIAGTRLREAFTATALLLVVGIALAMGACGLSPALGTFVAGVVLAIDEDV